MRRNFVPSLLLVASCAVDGTSSFGDAGLGSQKGDGVAPVTHIDGTTDPASALNEMSSGPATTAGVCPAGLTCDVACGAGQTTTVRGKVYDPAGKNPLYGVAVYVPATPLSPLPRGVPTGADACSCGALYASGAVTSTTTALDGSFTLTNVPVGAEVPLVVQLGKWRRSLHLAVAACQENAAGPVSMPGSISPGDTMDSMPDIAISTGSKDSLECLLVRVGVSPTEYVAGSATSGHIHLFAGGDPTLSVGSGVVGEAEAVNMPGAPVSSTSLWSDASQLMPYDVVLLSCEGGETYDANPPALETYLNAGGRAFASHFHYSWFSGPLNTKQAYSAPPDWGNLATWYADEGLGVFGTGAVGGLIDQTLNGTGKAFPKGAAMSTWLDENGALGGDGVAATDLPIYQPRYNASVGPSNTQSQPWITAATPSENGASTMFFSFDTPVNAATPAGATSPAYCGRAVFSDLHVSGNPGTSDDMSKPPPASCDMVELSPQEKALEFMLFDLSSCVVPDSAPIPAPPSAK